MSWEVRHEGSPHATTGLTAHQVVDGLHEGVWEPTDEVRGPGDIKWVAMEEHPVFEEAVAAYEAPKRTHHDDSHLDMNPLIDVALVLLIFFILKTSFDALVKVLDMPGLTKKGNTIRELAPNDLNDMVKVKAYMEGNEAVIEIDGEKVTLAQLKTAVSRAASQNKSKMVMDIKDVNWDTVLQIVDAARANGMKIMMRVTKE